MFSPVSSVHEPSSLSEVPRTRGVREQVRESLRLALMSGELAPGVIYSAPSLARKLGVSPTPVREAMLELVRDGSVRTLRNSGFQIVEVEPAVLDHWVEIRMLIEPPIMGSVAANCVGDIARQVIELLPTAHELEEARRAKDLIRYVALDTEFHTRFLAFHGNLELVEVIRGLREKTRLYGLSRELESDDPVSDEHRAMIDLALARDSSGMEQLVRTHVGRVRGEWA